MTTGDKDHVCHVTGRHNSPLIELGWLIVNELDRKDLEIVTRARDKMLELLQTQFDEFTWRMPVIQQSEPAQANLEEPTVLLHEGVREGDARHWDYTFVITRTDLKSYYRSRTIAVPSQALNVAVISIARLAAAQPPPTAENEAADSLMAERICALGMHLLGDLNGLGHRHESEAFMYLPQKIDELSKMKAYSEEEQSHLRKSLSEVADVRLEEQPRARRSSVVTFYLRAMWFVRDEILTAVIQAHPWEFPFRFNRLTAAAMSALLILTMTAEVWDLGLSQPAPFISGFSLLILLATSAFILKRQKLLLRRGRSRLTEHRVVTNVSISIIVLLGMMTTYMMLFLFTLLLGHTLFDEALLQSWATSVNGPITLGHFVVFAELVASLGILIGALGASFEGQHYFRHIAYVDEEL